VYGNRRIFGPQGMKWHNLYFSPNIIRITTEKIDRACNTRKEYMDFVGKPEETTRKTWTQTE
jgi:hypothetical protein